MGNTASTLQPPSSDGGHGGPERERSRSPSVRRSLGRDRADRDSPSALSLAASSTLQHQQRLAQQQRYAQQQQPGPSASSHVRASTYDPSLSTASYHHQQGSSSSGSGTHSPQALLTPLPTLSHPHPQSHAYAFANQASLEPGLSALHSHPFSNPSSPGVESIHGESGIAAAAAAAAAATAASANGNAADRAMGGRPRSGSTGLVSVPEGAATSRSSHLGLPDERMAVRSRSVKVTPSNGGASATGPGSGSAYARGESPSSTSRRSASVSSPLGQVRSGHGIVSADRTAAHHLIHPHHHPSPLRTELAPGTHGSSRRRTHEGLQLGMGFDPTTVVSSNPTTPLVATQNRHASGTPSHLEPAHPSTAFSALDVRRLEHQAQASAAGGPLLPLDRPKFQKRESGSGTPTQMDAPNPCTRTPAATAAQPLPVHRGKEPEPSFGIGDTTLENGGFGLDIPRGIAVPGSSAITDDDVSTPPEAATRKDPLGRTLPAALPSYLRIPTGDIVDEDNTLDYINATTSPGGPDDVDPTGAVDSSTGGGGAGKAGRRISGLGGPAGHRADQAVPFMAILLTWRGGGHNVSVTGTFANEWRSRIPLARNPTGSRKDRNEFSCLLHLPPGTHRLKFLVDDRWRVSPDLSTATDGEGMLVNYVEIPNVGPDHTGPLSAPGEDLPDEGGAQAAGADPRRAEDDFKFPSAYLRASRLGKAALTQLQDPAYGLQTPQGGTEQGLLEPAPRPLSQHGKEPSAALSEEGGLVSTDELGYGQVPEAERKAGTPLEAPSNRSSHYAESTASSGMAASMHHTDLKITPLDARMELDDDRRRGSLEDVFGEDKKKKLAEAASWTRDIPESIYQAQIAEELERERLDALEASGAPPPNSHHGHGHGHGHGHHEPKMPAPPSLPRQLEKVILNSGPAGLAGAVDDNSVLPAPNHVVLSHLTASSIKGGVLAVGTTTRYKRKYVTTVFHRPVR
ncbi:galactose metabolism- protein [Tilletia horrida]|nr:galactose metabolism- protein [Tilletia horrida]